MTSIIARSLLVVCATVFMTQAASAKVGDKVKIVGCAKKVPPFCVLIKGQDGKTYSVGSAVPAVPTDNQAVLLTGTVSGDFSLCFATPLSNIKWVPIKMKCPKN